MVEPTRPVTVEEQVNRETSRVVPFGNNVQSWLALQGPTDPPSEQPLMVEPTHHVTLEGEVNRETSCVVPFGNNVQIEKEVFSNRLYTRVLTRIYNKLINDAKIGNTMKEHLRNSQQYISTPLGRRLHGMAMVYAPKVGTETMETIVALSSAAFAANMGVHADDLVHIGRISPSARTLKALVCELACDSVMVTSTKIKGKDLALICDKGEDKKNGASFVKLFAFGMGLQWRLYVLE